MDLARQEIGRAIERVREKVATPEAPGGVLVLADMFGGTPANLGVTFLETDKVEVITGLNLAMLMKLARPLKDTDLLTLAREIREQGRNAIWVALGPDPRARRADVARSCEISDPERPRACTRARRRSSSTRPGAFAAHIRVARGEREVDGKSIMGLLLLAAAQGSAIRITADGADEDQAPSPRSARWSSAASTRRRPHGSRDRLDMR